MKCNLCQQKITESPLKYNNEIYCSKECIRTEISSKTIDWLANTISLECDSHCTDCCPEEKYYPEIEGDKNKGIFMNECPKCKKETIDFYFNEEGEEPFCSDCNAARLLRKEEEISKKIIQQEKKKE